MEENKEIKKCEIEVNWIKYEIPNDYAMTKATMITNCFFKIDNKKQKS